MPILYHFTAPEYLASIKESGIWRGDVPTSPTGGFNAPWLTADGSWPNQGWAKGSMLDKAGVRLTVAIPDNDPDLVSWPDLAEQENVDPSWYAVLDKTGGGNSRDWFVYRGKMPWRWVTKVETHEAEETPQDLVLGWGVGKTGTPSVPWAELAARLRRIAQESGHPGPKFDLGTLAITDRALARIGRVTPENDDQVDTTTMLLVKHLASEPNPNGVSSLHDVDGVIYRVLTALTPTHETTIMLADET